MTPKQTSSWVLTAVGMATMMIALAGAPSAVADPDPELGPDSSCETGPTGASFCDGPLRADGSWTRCVTTPPIWRHRVYVPPTRECADYDADNPPGPNQPPQHIEEGR